MSIKLNDKYVSSFIREHEIAFMQDQVTAADRLLREKCGPGSDFLGWVDLPEAYDKEEFARIQAAAKKIQKSCDIFVVIGIGGSYLGARAVIEYLNHFAPQKIIGKIKICHIGASGGTVHGKETKSRTRDIIKMAIGKRHKFI